MTDEQMRVAVAEWCGRPGPYETEMRWHEPHNDCAQEIAVLLDAFGCEIPDYPNDLNAVHEVEKGLTDEQRRRYSWHLCDTIGPRGYDEWSGLYDFALAHATARQRCVALLRVWGARIDEPKAKQQWEDP